MKKLLEVVRDISLPPELIITRCGSWINASIYYAEIMNEFDAIEAKSIEEAQYILQKKDIRKDLIFIRDNLECISSAMSKLEIKNLPL